MLSDHRLFFRQFRDHFHSTGSLAPSSRWLSRALASYIRPEGQGDDGDASLRFLEVGPGTGAVTRWIVPRLGSNDSLDLVELNAAFVERLRELFANHPAFMPAAERVRILHQPVEELSADVSYDAIVSGLPLNNFSPEVVELILRTLTGLLAPGGTLSFFEYVAVRPAKLVLSSRRERLRLREVSRQLKAVLAPHEFRRQCVLLNLPPAWVHHVRMA